MTEITSEEILISALPEKCTRQPVLIAKLRQRCLSNLTQKDRFTAEIVFLTTGHPEKTADIKLSDICLIEFTSILISFSLF